ncbi:MAG: pantoate--beta-alanine ligase [Acidimicrobiia bacterium]|nr:pantoate--beta-alanine ligase [Acidimicrobiia bacterium]MCY4456573.1 pantoate--beta-alanine ligase [Acidimicrobiaceae bacterium]
MEQIATIDRLQKRLNASRRKGHAVGYVPTLGSLHAGHFSLVAASKRENRVTVVSVFLNPLQFAAEEDLEIYPQDIPKDLVACKKHGVDYVFVPSVKELYPDRLGTMVNVPSLSAPFEGAIRPTHFGGVATVLTKLFSIVGPCRTYFGEKDWQQVCVVKRLVSDLSLPVEVVVCPTIRENDGLALSSRNIFLSEDQREQAPVLRACLDAGIAAIRGGETDAEEVQSVMAKVISNGGAELDYVAAVQADTLECEGPLHGEVRLLVAARFGTTRLIDNDGITIQ